MLRNFFLILTLSCVVFDARPAGKFTLSVPSIMRGPQLVGYEPTQVRWSGDGSRIYFHWKKYTEPHEKDMSTWEVKPDGTGLRELSDEETKGAAPAAGDLSPDKTKTVYVRDGDLFLYEQASGKTTQLTKTSDAEINPHFTKDGKRIYYTRANNLFVLSLDGAALIQLTDIRLAGAGATQPAASAGGAGRGQGQGGARGAANRASGEPPKGTPSQEFLKQQEKELLQIVRERAAKREEAEAKEKRENPRKPFTLTAQQSIPALQLTPDEKHVVALISETTPGVKQAEVPNYVTESGYTEDIQSRNFVGDNQTRLRLAILDVETGEVKYVDHGQKVMPKEADKAPASSKPETKADAKPGERTVQLTLPIWSEDGTKAFLIGRAEDHKDRWIFALDPSTGKTRVLASDHDDAWLGGPTGFAGSAAGWMRGDNEIYFDSERSGYSHLYAVNWNGGQPRALTAGKWEVLDAKLSRDKSHFFLNTNEVGPAEKHVYVMDADGGTRTRLTAAPGGHRAWFSPDERTFVDLYSYVNKPPDLFAQAANIDAKRTRLTVSPSPEFAEYPWLDTPVIQFKARDGAEIPARLFVPDKLSRNGPAVVFVHGAGYLQNVGKFWSSNYYREYLFHHLLREKGYTVIDLDYRGSAGYGRDWRTAIYEHMGGKDLDDAVDAAKYLVADRGVDARRIGIYGGSYGGFLTLMGLFTASDTFAAGAALRPVTDWSHYNHPYTSDILNTPQADAEAYKRSSPIYFAQNLKGALLICHGMVDTNVHFQDTVRLTQRLIELGKTNWNVAIYPAEDHGFVEPSSWTDEYSRILDLFEKNLKGPKS